MGATSRSNEVRQVNHYNYDSWSPSFRCGADKLSVGNSGTECAEEVTCPKCRSIIFPMTGTAVADAANKMECSDSCSLLKKLQKSEQEIAAVMGRVGLTRETLVDFVRRSGDMAARIDAAEKKLAESEDHSKMLLRDAINPVTGKWWKDIATEASSKERELLIERDADKSVIQELLSGLADAAADLRRHDSAVASSAASDCDRLIEKHYTRRDVDAEERHSDQLKRLERMENRLRNYHSDDPEKFEDAKEEIGGDANEPSMESLRKWVKKSREEAEKDGAIFDTGFRCVSEGGEVFYFDPEEVSDYMDAADSLRAENQRLEKLVKEQLAGWGKSDNEVERLMSMLDRVATALGFADRASGEAIELQAKKLMTASSEVVRDFEDGKGIEIAVRSLIRALSKK